MSTETATGRYTALYGEHQKLGASFTDFGGWQMPLKYGSELAEHRAVRATAGLFDLSHMGEIWVEGPEAAKFLDYALVGNLGAVAAGRAKYSLICNAEGGIIDDLICYRRPATGKGDRYLVVPNAGNAATVAAALAERAVSGPAGAFEVTVTDASAATSLIAVQGPESVRILLKLVPAGQHDTVRRMKYYAADEVEFTFASGAHRLLLARTGYTGEDGFELYVPNEAAAALWEALLEAGRDAGLAAAGLACRDSLRLEAGMPLYGNELSLQVTPFEAGLGPVVSFRKESDFVGRAALEARRAQGPARRLVGLKGLGRRAARSHYPVLKDGAVVGEVTSGAPSPTLGHPVALAYVDAGLAGPGTRLEVDLRGKAEPFEVVELPFYRRTQ